MATPLYSYLFLAESGFTGEAAFEIPDGLVAVVRDIDVVAGISVGGQVWAYDTAGHQFWANTFTEITGGKVWAGFRGRQVVPGPGYVYVSTDFACDFRCSGYLLSGAPAS